ncbi:MAG: hypothetical protein JSV49_04205 [Thermoplasmata archaeon]|nr:MAG: hypothetical protein JSV49_04205 [Thermoplasmata archaeon]
MVSLQNPDELALKGKIRQYIGELRELRTKVYEFNISLRYLTIASGQRI